MLPKKRREQLVYMHSQQHELLIRFKTGRFK